MYFEWTGGILGSQESHQHRCGGQSGKLPGGGVPAATCWVVLANWEKGKGHWESPHLEGNMRQRCKGVRCIQGTQNSIVWLKYMGCGDCEAKAGQFVRKPLDHTKTSGGTLNKRQRRISEVSALKPGPQLILENSLSCEKTNVRNKHQRLT